MLKYVFVIFLVDAEFDFNGVNRVILEAYPNTDGRSFCAQWYVQFNWLKLLNWMLASAILAASSLQWKLKKLRSAELDSKSGKRLRKKPWIFINTRNRLLMLLVTING